MPVVGEQLPEPYPVNRRVDGEYPVRLLDVRLEGRFGDSVESISIRFYDIGEPITIEAPDHATPIDPMG